MAVPIPVALIPGFDPHGEPTTVHQRWKKRIRSFNIYASAAGCEDKKQKREQLLHSDGSEVQDISETLTDTGDEYDKAAEKLMEYFTPLKNVPFNSHVFRLESQTDDETVAQFVIRLHRLAATCDFGVSTEDFIRDQVIDKCKSMSLRTKLLAEKDSTLKKLLDIANAKEASESRCAQFNDADGAFAVHTKPAKQKQQKFKKPQDEGKKKQNKDIKCCKCGQKGHHGKECRCSRDIKCFKCGRLGHFASVCRNTQNKEKISFAQTAENDNKSSDESEFGFNVDSKLKSVTITINGVDVSMIIDSGASCNIINTQNINVLKDSGIVFTNSNRTIHPYCSPPIKASVQATVTIGHGNESTTADIICLEGNSPPLLGRKTAEILKVLALENVYLAERGISDLEKHYPGVTKGIGKLKGTSVQLYVDPSITPVARKHTRVPFQLRKKVETELTRLESEGIIEKVTGPTEWISPLVVVEKPKNKSEVRLCIDMKEPNKAILRTKHVTPTIDELTVDLRNAKI